MYFDILCKYYSTSGITSYSIDFLIYITLFTQYMSTYLFHFLDLLRCLRPLLCPATLCGLILVFSNPHDHLIVDLGRQLSFDIHERLQEHLLSHEFELLFLVLLFY